MSLESLVLVVKAALRNNADKNPAASRMSDLSLRMETLLQKSESWKCEIVLVRGNKRKHVAFQTEPNELRTRFLPSSKLLLVQVELFACGRTLGMRDQPFELRAPPPRVCPPSFRCCRQAKSS